MPLPCAAWPAGRRAAGCSKARRPGSSMRGTPDCPSSMPNVRSRARRPGSRRFSLISAAQTVSVIRLNPASRRPASAPAGFDYPRVPCRMTSSFFPRARRSRPSLRRSTAPRIYVAAMCCAMVSASLRRAQTYGETRQSFGKPLNQHPTWREPLAKAATRLAAAWALVEAAITAVESGAETRHLAAAAKVNAVTLAQSELPTLLHAMGAEGLRESEPFTRHIGAAQVAALTDGSTAMLLDRLGRWDPTPIEL